MLVQFQCSFHSLGCLLLSGFQPLQSLKHKNLLNRRSINCAVCCSGYQCTDFSFATTKRWVVLCSLPSLVSMKALWLNLIRSSSQICTQDTLSFDLYRAVLGSFDFYFLITASLWKHRVLSYMMALVTSIKSRHSSIKKLKVPPDKSSFILD